MTVLLYLLKIEEYIKVHEELEQQENIHLIQHVKNTLGYFKEQECFEYEFPYEHVKLHEKVIVYGAGACGQKIVSQIKCTDYVDMVLWVDKAWESYAERGYEVCSPEKLEKAETDCIIIAVEKIELFEKIKEELIEKNWSTGKRIVGPIPRKKR